ncbi:MAG: hypothetical protein WC240_06940 [Bacilli bacterium]
MNLDEKIKLLASKSKASVTISINPNKNCDETITDYIDTISGMCIIDNDITDDVKQKMNENDTLVEIEIYPIDKEHSFTLISYGIENAIDMALDYTNKANGIK